MKRLFLLALSCAALYSAQAQTDQTKLSKTTKEKGTATSTTSASNGRPADFPKYVDTGNPEADKASYRAAKKAWMDLHYPQPKAKHATTTGTTTSKTASTPNHNSGQKKTISQADFDKMPENKKQHILSHPESYEVK